MRTVLDRLRLVGLKVKPSKCILFKTQIEYLGHLVSAAGIHTMQDKVDALRDFPVPRCIKDVRSFIGLASYYRKFVKGFVTIAEPLTRLLGKPTRFEWNPKAQKAFEALKEALMQATSLAFPIPNIPCILDTDATEVVVGAVLSQKIDGIERPIAFFSRVMPETQCKYCTTRRELLAVVCTVQHFRHYLYGTKVILCTDHYSLKWLRTFKTPKGILARWIETLAEFDIEIEHRPGLSHSNVDGMSRPFCRQCFGKEPKVEWVDELERADELTELLGVRHVTVMPEISDDEMKELQAEDPDLGLIVEWLRLGQCPTNEYLKSKSQDTPKLWTQVPAIYLLDEIFVRKFSDDSQIQLIVPKALRKRLFDVTHAGPLAAHLGSERTLLQLKQLHYWPSMTTDVSLWYSQCEVCAQSHGPPTKHQGRLQKVLTGVPLDIVAIDILSGLPTTADGMKYILVVTDYFTKWASAFPLPDAEASTCVRVL